jgi:hypothetical protein
MRKMLATAAVVLAAAGLAVPAQAKPVPGQEAYGTIGLAGSDDLCISVIAPVPGDVLHMTGCHDTRKSANWWQLTRIEGRGGIFVAAKPELAISQLPADPSSARLQLVPLGITYQPDEHGRYRLLSPEGLCLSARSLTAAMPYLYWQECGSYQPKGKGRTALPWYQLWDLPEFRTE